MLMPTGSLGAEHVRFTQCKSCEGRGNLADMLFIRAFRVFRILLRSRENEPRK